MGPMGMPGLRPEELLSILDRLGKLEQRVSELENIALPDWLKS